MFYPFFSAAFAISACYLASQKNLVPRSFDRTDYQISKLFYEMGNDMARHGLDNLDKVKTFYSGQHAPQLIGMIYNSITQFDPVPDQYIHPRISLFTAENNIKFAATILADYALSKSQILFEVTKQTSNNLYNKIQDFSSILSDQKECDTTQLITQMPFDISFQALLIPVAISALDSYGMAYLKLGLDFSMRHLSCLYGSKNQESQQNIQSPATDLTWGDYLVEAADNTYLM